MCYYTCLSFQFHKKNIFPFFFCCLFAQFSNKFPKHIWRICISHLACIIFTLKVSSRKHIDHTLCVFVCGLCLVFYVIHCEIWFSYWMRFSSFLFCSRLCFATLIFIYIHFAICVYNTFINVQQQQHCCTHWLFDAIYCLLLFCTIYISLSFTDALHIESGRWTQMKPLSLSYQKQKSLAC